MNFRFSPRAESEAEKKREWWRTNRPSAPDLFDEELAATIEQVTKTPTIGAIYPSGHDIVVRRALMAATKNHVYYAVNDGEIIILSVWGAPRRRGPKLVLG